MCLPKFNPTGFVNAYVAFLRKPEHNEVDASNTDSGGLDDRQGHPADPSQQTGQLDAGIGLVCVSGGGEFETVRGWCDTVTEVCDFIAIPDSLFFNRDHDALQKLASSGILDSISDVIDSGKAQYTVSQLGIPGLRHFIYKSRPHVQITFPVLEDPYEKIEEKRRYYPQSCTCQICSFHLTDLLPCIKLCMMPFTPSPAKVGHLSYNSFAQRKKSLWDGLAFQFESLTCSKRVIR